MSSEGGPILVPPLSARDKVGDFDFLEVLQRT